MVAALPLLLLLLLVGSPFLARAGIIQHIGVQTIIGDGCLYPKDALELNPDFPACSIALYGNGFIPLRNGSTFIVVASAAGLTSNMTLHRRDSMFAMYADGTGLPLEFINSGSVTHGSEFNMYSGTVYDELNGYTIVAYDFDLNMAAASADLDTFEHAFSFKNYVYAWNDAPGNIGLFRCEIVRGADFVVLGPPAMFVFTGPSSSPPSEIVEYYKEDIPYASSVIAASSTTGRIVMLWSVDRQDGSPASRCTLWEISADGKNAAFVRGGTCGNDIGQSAQTVPAEGSIRARTDNTFTLLTESGFSVIDIDTNEGKTIIPFGAGPPPATGCNLESCKFEEFYDPQCLSLDMIHDFHANPANPTNLHVAFTRGAIATITPPVLAARTGYVAPLINSELFGLRTIIKRTAILGAGLLSIDDIDLHMPEAFLPGGRQATSLLDTTLPLEWSSSCTTNFDGKVLSESDKLIPTGADIPQVSEFEHTDFNGVATTRFCYTKDPAKGFGHIGDSYSIADGGACGIVDGGFIVCNTPPLVTNFTFLDPSESPDGKDGWFSSFGGETYTWDVKSMYDFSITRDSDGDMISVKGDPITGRVQSLGGDYGNTELNFYPNGVLAGLNTPGGDNLETYDVPYNDNKIGVYWNIEWKIGLYQLNAKGAEECIPSG